MSQEIHDLFHDKAYAYSKGQLKYLSLLFLTPCQFCIGSQVLMLETSQDVEDVFATYRKNLLKQDYVKTIAEVLHIAVGVDGTTHCLVTYANSGRSGEVISVEHANYVLRRSKEGFLRIRLVEFVDEANPELFKGMETLLAQQVSQE